MHERLVMVAFCGLPGSGKSTLAKALEKATGWTRLDRDGLRRDVFPAGGYEDADKRRLAGILTEQLRVVLASGNSVILDGMTLSRADERSRFENIARELDASWLLVWMDCDVTVARTRVAADRHHPAEDRTAALVDDVSRRFEIPGDALRIDAALPTPVQRNRILERLRVERRGK